MALVNWLVRAFTPGVGEVASSPGNGGSPAARGGSGPARSWRACAQTYPHARLALDFQTPLQLLMATVLAAQCTDERVNMVTPALFRRYPTARDYAAADLAELEEMVRTTGFFRNKARALKNLGQALAAEHGGEVPASLEALVALPGRRPEDGQRRAGQRLRRATRESWSTPTSSASPAGSASTEETDPEKIERDLMPVVPREEWTRFALLLQDHGRKICKARKPECAICPVADLCPSAEV